MNLLNSPAFALKSLDICIFKKILALCSKFVRLKSKLVRKTLVLVKKSRLRLLFFYLSSNSLVRYTISSCVSRFCFLAYLENIIIYSDQDFLCCSGVIDLF